MCIAAYGQHIREPLGALLLYRGLEVSVFMHTVCVIAEIPVVYEIPPTEAQHAEMVAAVGAILCCLLLGSIVALDLVQYLTCCSKT